MIPFNCCCSQCGEYIYKGKKFNAKREIAKGEYYLGIIIWRFYIKCPKCLNEISFKTDLKNLDYELEHGATRNFQAEKLLEEQVKLEKAEKDKEDPMQALENRTRDSRREIDILENLEELRDLQAKLGKLDPLEILTMQEDIERKVKEQQEQEDEDEIKRLFGKDKSGVKIKRVIDDSTDSENSDSDNGVVEQFVSIDKPTDILGKESSVVKDETATDSGVVVKKLTRPDLGIIRKCPAAGLPVNSQPVRVPQKSQDKTGLSILTNYSSSDTD